MPGATAASGPPAGSVSAPRRTLLEWFAGALVDEIPNSRIASALRRPGDGSWDGWLVSAARALGWEAERVEAAPRAIGGERECWWVSCSTRGPERWLVLTGERAEESRASVIDGATARDVPNDPETLAEVLGLEQSDEPVTWVRVTPELPLQPLRSGGAPEKVPPFERLRRWVRLERTTVWAVVAYSAVIGVISLALPLAVQSLVNSLALGRLLQPLIVISMGLLFLLTLAAALRVLEVYIVELLQRRMFSDVARDLARRLPGVRDEAGGPWGLTERINRFFDVVGAQKAASFLLLGATEVVMSSIAGLLVLGFYHPYLLIFDLVLIASLTFVIFRLGRGGIGTAVEESHAKYELAAWLESIARQKRRFASPEGATWAARNTDRLTVEWLGRRSDHFRILLRQTIGFAAIQAFASASLLGLGGFLVWNGQLTLGQLVASELIITSVVSQLAKFGKHVESFYDLNASVDKLGTLFDLPTEPASGELLEQRDKGLRLDVRSVSLGGVSCSFSAAPGERVGLVGVPHGARKCLFATVFGTRAPESGQILLDEVSVRALAPRARRHQLAWLESALPVGASLEENLSSQDSETTADDMRQALSRVGLGHLVRELDDGLRTWIHPDGEPLGRDDQLAIQVARLLLRSPRLVMIDHALDVLDPNRAEALADALAERAWTVIWATERPELLARCDRVIRWSGQGLVESSS
ncbi:MAG TPA: hypothetical protein RMG48_03130 [Myxococcales bacterium LLY-WYZ-16_1]|nr:hypothetical protein [Myxococcales bacterium LLY-WYZ-16_1]